ncbi:hypothetical protein SBV1_1890022 [Verrucomicrobia bacterium]|nr:hypothetical protein SBV1_1890022 [Verrucomicrobiota bacterium]
MTCWELARLYTRASWDAAFTRLQAPACARPMLLSPSFPAMLLTSHTRQTSLVPHESDSSPGRRLRRAVARVGRAFQSF